MTDERLCKCDLCKEEFTTTETDWHFGADLIQCKAINICDKCCHHDNGHWATWSEIEYALTEVKRLRYIVDSIPDEAWEDMKTWEAMKGVIE